MDYVTHMLGLQGWERVHKLDNYFCGEEDLVPDVSDAPPSSVGTELAITCDCATQTPREWLLLEPAQERKEGRELLSVITGKVGLVRIVMSGAELNAATIRGDYAAVSKLLKSGVSSPTLRT